MRVVEPEVAAERFRLYKEGLNDREIAEEVGCSSSGIRYWRNKEKLPAQIRRSTGYAGVPMEKALSPSQCEIMREFLGSLLCLQDQYPDDKVEINVFMKEFRKYC